MSISCKKPPFTRAMFIDRSKFCEQFFKKDHPRNIPVKLFQNLASSFGEEDIFKNFFMSVWCKKPPFTRAMFMDVSKFHEQFFEKGHQRNIPVKLFQNLTSGFREEDFLRISSCLYSA